MAVQAQSDSKANPQPRPFLVVLVSLFAIILISWAQSRLFGTRQLSGATGFMAGSLIGVLAAAWAFMTLTRRARWVFLSALTATCLALNVVGYSLRVQLSENQLAVTDSRPLGESVVHAARLTSYSLIPGHFLVPFPQFVRESINMLFPPPPKLRPGEYPLQFADVGVFVAPALALNVFLTLLVVVGIYSTLQRRLRAA